MEPTSGRLPPPTPGAAPGDPADAAAPDPVRCGPSTSEPTLPVPPDETSLLPDETGSDPGLETTADDEGGGGGASGRRQVVRFRARQQIVRGVAVVVLLLVGYYLISVFQVWSTGRSDDRDPVDAIVVLGAAQFDGRPSPTFAARLDHVVELWPDDVAPLVVTTGGNQPGDRFTEAESGRNYLVDRGVPAEAILLEDRGSTTYESLDAVADLLAERGLDEIVIVTDPYHALRSRLIAEDVGLEASVSSTTTSVVTGWSSFTRHLQEGAGVALGRIVGFDRLDDWTN